MDKVERYGVDFQPGMQDAAVELLERILGDRKHGPLQFVSVEERVHRCADGSTLTIPAVRRVHCWCTPRQQLERGTE